MTDQARLGQAIPLGINLSFCVKRWVTPDLWAPIVRDELGLDLVQFSFDLVDPAWPEDLLKTLATEIRGATERHGISIHSAFIGLAHYTFSQLLHPEPIVRDYAEAWLAKAYRFAAAAGISRVGGPLGAVASRLDGTEPESISEADYADLIARMQRLSAHAREIGLVELYVEPTPMRREWPWTIGQARRMADDLGSCPVPWHYCVDWGHATFEPLYGRYRATMESWLRALPDVITAIHIQQTDYQYDRHWDFTVPGAVDPEDAAALLRTWGLSRHPVFLEVFYPFERDDKSILEALKQTVSILRPALS